MRFPSRPVLAASVLAALAASGGTILTMPGASADAAQASPDAASAPGLRSPAPSEVPTAAGPPVSGAQIAGLALAPAKDRAATLAAQQAAQQEAAAKAAAEERARQEAARAAEEARQDQQPSGSNDWEKFRRELREACDDGRVRGQICRGA